jgi:hypothetical protein
MFIELKKVLLIHYFLIEMLRFLLKSCLYVNLENIK